MASRLWVGNHLTRTGTRNWPPGEKFKEDRDARVWFNSRYTPSDRLMEACSYFLSQGWPAEALDEFLKDIEPKEGWYSVVPTHSIPTRRNSRDYGPAVNALMHGYWSPKKPDDTKASDVK